MFDQVHCEIEKRKRSRGLRLKASHCRRQKPEPTLDDHKAKCRSIFHEQDRLASGMPAQVSVQCAPRSLLSVTVKQASTAVAALGAPRLPGAL